MTVKQVDLKKLAHEILITLKDLLANMKKAFMYVDKDMVKSIIMNIIRPILGYNVVVWSPGLRKYIDILKRVHQAAIGWSPTLRDLNGDHRLKNVKLATLEERRKRGDMIML